MRLVLVLVLVAACGRFGFGAHESGDGGGSGGDGPRSDVPGGDGPAGDGAGSDAPAAYVCPSGLDLCDTFEAGALDTGTWMADSLVSLDTTRAHRGSQSIHVHQNAFAANTNSYQTLLETKTIALEPGTFYIRAWFWLSALPAGQNGMELISAEKPGSASGDYVFVFSDSTHIYTQYGNASRTAMTTVPVGQWFCVLFKVVRSTTTAGSLTSSGDIAALNLPAVVTDSTTLTMNSVFLGMGFSQNNVPVAQPALDLWIDDVIIHSAPVTCTD